MVIRTGTYIKHSSANFSFYCCSIYSLFISQAVVQETLAHAPLYILIGHVIAIPRHNHHTISTAQSNPFKSFILLRISVAFSTTEYFYSLIFIFIFYFLVLVQKVFSIFQSGGHAKPREVDWTSKWTFQ